MDNIPTLQERLEAARKEIEILNDPTLSEFARYAILNRLFGSYITTCTPTPIDYNRFSI